jgi:PIN domain nuclease of toxin-antitoxin system
MTTYVLDASALIRFIDNEPGADRVEAILEECGREEAGICLSAVQWGEVVGNTYKRFTPQEQFEILSGLLPRAARILAADQKRAENAARFKVDYKISYADAFALELAMESADRLLVTADYGFKPLESLARIEFLPAK